MKQGVRRLANHCQTQLPDEHWENSQGGGNSASRNMGTERLYTLIRSISLCLILGERRKPTRFYCDKTSQPRPPTLDHPLKYSAFPFVVQQAARRRRYVW